MAWGIFGSLANVIGATGLAISAGSAFLSYQEGQERNTALNKQADARNRANEAQKRQNALRLNRERRKTVREARIKRASAVSNAMAQNAQGSVSGGFGSVISQASNNLAFLNQSNIFAQQGTQALSEAASFGSKATQASSNLALYKSFTNMGGSIFNKREGISSISRSIFT